MNSAIFYLSQPSNGCCSWVFEELEYSRLYIHKWRVPYPIPKAVQVIVSNVAESTDEDSDGITEEIVNSNPESRNNPISRFVYYVSSHGETIRFDAHGDSVPFQSIYIPKQLLEEHCSTKMLRVVINWM